MVTDLTSSPVPRFWCGEAYKQNIYIPMKYVCLRIYLCTFYIYLCVYVHISHTLHLRGDRG